MKYFITFLIILFLLSGSSSYSQSDQVKNYLKMVALGKIDEVKLALPDLLAEYPDDAGVMLLHGTVIDDASKAVEIYEKIVRKYPNSEFADDAYWRIVQYYAVSGDTTKAESELDNFRKMYPQSEYLTVAADIVHDACAIIRTNSKNAAAKIKKSNTDNSLEEEEKDTKPVKDIKVQTPVADTDDEAPTQPMKGSFGLQVGIYSNYDAAKSEVERFRSQRMKAEIMNKKVDGNLMYAVVIGDYTSRDSAEAAKNIVQQQCNCNPIIFNK